LFSLGFADTETNLASIVVSLADDTWLHLLDDAHHLVHHRAGERISDDFLYLARLDLCMGDGIGSGLAIGNDESAGTEVHTPIIAHDYNQDVGKFVGVDLSEYGLTGCAGGLAIVVGTEIGTLRAEHIGVADMAGIVVFLAVAGQKVLDFIDRRHMMSEGEELTPLVGVVTLASALYGLVFVRHNDEVSPAVRGKSLIVILLPALDLHIVEVHGGEGLDEGLGQTDVGHQRNVVVDGATTDLITVGELT